jgi:hypothetical protein
MVLLQFLPWGHAPFQHARPERNKAMDMYELRDQDISLTEHTIPKVFDQAEC